MKYTITNVKGTLNCRHYIHISQKIQHNKTSTLLNVHAERGSKDQQIGVLGGSIWNGFNLEVAKPKLLPLHQATTLLNPYKIQSFPYC